MMEEPMIGPTLRRLREQSGRSQSEQADALSDLLGRPVTRNEVNRWEMEKRIPTPYTLGYYAESFGVPVKELRQAVAASRARRRLEKQQAGRDGEEKVLRREFIGASLAAAGLTVGATQPATAGRLGLSDVRQLQARTARLRRLDEFLGGADTYRLYVAEVENTAALLKRATLTEPIERALHGVLAEQIQQAGWAAFDAGMQDEATRLYKRSLDAAHQAGNAALAGNSLAYLGYQQVSRGKLGTEAAAEACRVAGSDSPARVRALLYERLAWSHAVAGNASEVKRALDEAEQALNNHDGQPQPDWVAWVDRTELQIMTGRCWAELHRPLRAVPVLENVLAGFDETQARDKALYMTWLVSAYLDAGEVEQAATTTGRVLDLATGVASVRPQQRVDGIVQRLAPYRNVPQVAEVLERVAD